MSAANFDMNLDGFPLYARSDIYIKVCPVCGLVNSDEEEICENCGENLEGVSSIYDEVENEIRDRETLAELEKLNEKLAFFRVNLQPGYYTGSQLIVEFSEDDPKNCNNEDCRYNWDLCRSVAIRKCAAERRRLENTLEKFATERGFYKYGISHAFGNGEVWYTRISA